RAKEHADNIKNKIREVFSKHEKSEKVDAALVLLDTLAEAWSERTGRPKEFYYDRYADVRQSTLDDLNKGKSLTFQKINVEDVISNATNDLSTEQELGQNRDVQVYITPAT